MLSRTWAHYPSNGTRSNPHCIDQVGTSIINPEGSNAVGGLYPAEVYERFPVMLRKLSYIYVLLSAIGCLAIEPPPPAEVPAGAKVPAKPAEGLTVSEALADKKFWIMWFMVRASLPISLLTGGRGGFWTK